MTECTWCHDGELVHATKVEGEGDEGYVCTNEDCPAVYPELREEAGKQ